MVKINSCKRRNVDNGQKEIRKSADKDESWIKYFRRQKKKVRRYTHKVPSYVVDLISKTRPKNRSECADGPRPCYWVGCKYHIIHDIKNALWVLNVETLIEKLPETCTLDVADMGHHTLGEIGDLLNVSRERIRQIESNAFKKITKRVERFRKDLVCDE